tara:strand:- start:103 stop:390 length:288 start_codon:yes stop_codon:yes gene_type:complete
VEVVADRILPLTKEHFTVVRVQAQLPGQRLLAGLLALASHTPVAVLMHKAFLLLEKRQSLGFEQITAPIFQMLVEKWAAAVPAQTLPYLAVSVVW